MGGRPIFSCALEDYANDDDAWFSIEAGGAEDAARAFIAYLDSRDSEYFPRPDDVHYVLVRVGGAELRFAATFDYVKSWRVRMRTGT